MAGFVSALSKRVSVFIASSLAALGIAGAAHGQTSTDASPVAAQPVSTSAQQTASINELPAGEKISLSALLLGVELPDAEKSDEPAAINEIPEAITVATIPSPLQIQPQPEIISITDPETFPVYQPVKWKTHVIKASSIVGQQPDNTATGNSSTVSHKTVVSLIAPKPVAIQHPHAELKKQTNSAFYLAAGTGGGLLLGGGIGLAVMAARRRSVVATEHTGTRFSMLHQIRSACIETFSRRFADYSPEVARNMQARLRDTVIDIYRNEKWETMNDHQIRDLLNISRSAVLKTRNTELYTADERRALVQDRQMICHGIYSLIDAHPGLDRDGKLMRFVARHSTGDLRKTAWAAKRPVRKTAKLYRLSFGLQQKAA